MDDQRTLLVSLSGHDRPGVTSALFGALAPFSVEVLDVEQVVIRGRLVLGVVGGHQPRHVDQVGGPGGLAGTGMSAHGSTF